MQQRVSRALVGVAFQTPIATAMETQIVSIHAKRTRTRRLLGCAVAGFRTPIETKMVFSTAKTAALTIRPRHFPVCVVAR
jgi:hypothetical protein